MSSVPLFAPDGSVRQVPPEQLTDALNAGGKHAVQMTDPSGVLRYVPEDQVSTAMQSGGKVYQPAPGFWHDPKTFLQTRAGQMGQEAQNQMNLAAGPESQGKSLLSRMGHAMLSGVPAIAQVVDKAASGLVGTDAQTWKNAAMVAAGAIDPAIPGAYFATQGTAELTGLTSGVNPGDLSPGNVQNALLAGSSVAGGASAAGMPNAGATLKAGPPIVRGAARATNAVLNKAPEYVIGGAGAAIGGYIGGGGTGAGIGGTIGAIAGRTLPKITIPGEKFGLPQPQPPTVYPGAPFPENPGTFPGAPYPESPSPEVLQGNALARGSQSGQPLPGAALGQIPSTQTKAAPQPANIQTPQTPNVQAAPESTPVPIGNFPQPKGNPYAPGPHTPDVMETAQSGQIAKHGYIPENQTLVLEFKNGRTYDYRGVPQEVYDAYRNAESQGSFFAQNIKGRYRTSFRGTVQPLKGAAKAQQALLSQSSALAQPVEAPPANPAELLNRYVGLE